ncbi:MAG: PaaI family thioesterase [Sandaracinaceae bacterium]|nr:PaaI family thioesterase [Sandaracinaceae bacterium]
MAFGDFSPARGEPLALPTEILRRFASSDSVGGGAARLRLPLRDGHLRPGPSVSGPTLMTLADTAIYFALLGELGPTLLAVTTNLNINFMRGCASGEIVADARLLKLGRRLAVGEVSIHPVGSDELIAHATVTYSIPPR